MRGEPGLGRAPQAALLLGGGRLERVASARAALGLHLDEREPPAAADDEIELVAADPDVRAEDAIAAQAVVVKRSLLVRVPQVRPRSCTVSSARSDGGSRTGPPPARPPCGSP